MPTYNGHTIITPTTRIQSSKPKEPPLEEKGVRIQDAYLGGSNVKQANKHIVITSLLKSLKFDLPVSCFDVSLEANIICVCSGKIVYAFNLETNVLKNEV